MDKHENINVMSSLERRFSGCCLMSVDNYCYKTLSQSSSVHQIRRVYMDNLGTLSLIFFIKAYIVTPHLGRLAEMTVMRGHNL